MISTQGRAVPRPYASEWVRSQSFDMPGGAIPIKAVSLCRLLLPSPRCFVCSQNLGTLCLLKDGFGKTAFDYANSDRKRSICGHLRVIVESDVRLYVTPESHPRRSRLNDVVPLIASFIV